jgi:hypothetical protein
MFRRFCPQTIAGFPVSFGFLLMLCSYARSELPAVEDNNRDVSFAKRQQWDLEIGDLRKQSLLFGGPGIPLVFVPTAAPDFRVQPVIKPSEQMAWTIVVPTKARPVFVDWRIRLRCWDFAPIWDYGGSTVDHQPNGWHDGHFDESPLVNNFPLGCESPRALEPSAIGDWHAELRYPPPPAVINFGGPRISLTEENQFKCHFDEIPSSRDGKGHIETSEVAGELVELTSVLRETCAHCIRFGGPADEVACNVSVGSDAG